jgi:hypothetical protein
VQVGGRRPGKLVGGELVPVWPGPIEGERRVEREEHAVAEVAADARGRFAAVVGVMPDTAMPTVIRSVAGSVRPGWWLAAPAPLVVTNHVS